MLNRSITFAIFFFGSISFIFAQNNSDSTWLLLNKKLNDLNYTLPFDKSKKVSISYTSIKRDTTNKATLNTYFWGDSTSYFYPASTIKLPLALIVLEWLEEPEQQNIGLDTKVKFDGTSLCNKYDYNKLYPIYHRTKNGESWEKLEELYNTSRNAICQLNGFELGSSLQHEKVIKIKGTSELQSIGNLVEHMLIYSDNNAFNRLYDILGQKYINNSLLRHGFKNVNIIHRFLICDSIQNRYTDGYRFLTKNSIEIRHQSPQTNEVPLHNSHSNPTMGKGQMLNRKILYPGRNFSDHNNLSVKDLHTIMTSLFFPESVPKKKQWRISSSSRKYIQKLLGMFPNEHEQLRFKAADSPFDCFTKYLICGNSEEDFPKEKRSFNIIGRAYGIMIDCAYIVDFNTGTEYILTAKIYTNKNDILNDGIYEYDQTGYPFMEKLGKAFFEISGSKNISDFSNPNLSSLKMLFD